MAILGSCAAPSQPAANPPASQATVQARAEAGVPPVPTRPVFGDEPKQCIEDDQRRPLPEASRFHGSEFKQTVEARLRTLTSCTKNMTQPSTLEVRLEPGATNRVERVLVTASETDDCEAIRCMKRGLLGVEPPPSADHSSIALTGLVSLSPHAAPQIQDQLHTIAERRTPSCLDEADAERKPQQGRLPPELIQSIIRAHYDKFRHCYEAGLGRNPHLTGRVAVRFVIGEDGGVSMSSITENTLRDCQVAACVRDQFNGLSFPPPSGGVVTVIYPILLEPG